RAALAAKLRKSCDENPAVRLNSYRADRIDVAEKICCDLAVLTKPFVERAVRVVTRHDEVLDSFRITEARTGGNDLTVRLNDNGVGLINVSGEVSSGDAARPEGRIEIASGLCVTHCCGCHN